MCVNFQQNRVSRSVKTVHTNSFAKKFKFHKFATSNNIFFKIDYCRHTLSYRVHGYQFSAKSGY